MASIKVKFRPSAVAGREGTVYYQIIHAGKLRQLPSDCRILPDEWDARHSAVAGAREGVRAASVLSARERVRCDVGRLARIVRRLEADGLAYTVDNIVDEFNRYASKLSLFRFMENKIDRLRRNGKMRTSETYTAALNSFRKFRGGEDVMLDCIDAEMMEAYEAWHQGRGVVPNTISFYMRILRAVYNRAVEDGVIENRHPFRHVYTGVDKTVKRALPLPVIKRINELDLAASPALDYARDMFMMSFMLRGMSFVDMAFLRKRDLVGGYVVYRRRKTGQLLTIRWTEEMQGLLGKYPANATDYLLPIQRKPGANEWYVYRNAGYNINRHLKTIARKLGLTIPLTLYVARHSWASAARNKGIPLGVISEGMGHNNEATTRIYLASLDGSVGDGANSVILQSL